ncbi:MAG: hypothetical protein WEA61_06405 [Anaerolineales bacterium]
MDIEKFLSEQVKPGETFTAGVASIDFINATELSGTPQQIADTKTAFLELVSSLIENQPIAVLNWSGDGGLLICDGARGFDDLVVVCDKTLGFLPFFNRSLGRFTYLNDDRIHVRIVCNSAFVQNTGEAKTFTAEVVNKTAKYERNIGIRDHLVVTSNIYSGLSLDFQRRLAPSSVSDNKLGPYYVLDALESNSIVRRNEFTSEKIRDWIAAAAKLKKYDEIMIFTYTNESLYEYLSTPLPGITIRVLARNWLKEAEEENAYNHKMSQTSPASELRRLWKKADVIKRDAEILIDERRDQPYKNEFNIRFYESRPLFKGIILRNSQTKRRIGYIGHYAWDLDWQTGGSPIIGENWSAVWLSEDGGSQSNMLDAVTSRFEELWENGKSFEELDETEQQQALIAQYKENVKAVWEIDDKPFLVIVPGREKPGRLYPLVGAEDLLAMRSVERFLREHGAAFALKIMTTGDSTEISKKWDGHLIYICHRTISPEYLTELKKGGFPYDIVTKEGGKPSIVHIPYKHEYFSPMDEDSPQERDFCLVAKTRRPDKAGSLFIIAGLHGMGTLAGAQYLTNQDQLRILFEARKNLDFCTVVECEFRELWEIVKMENVTFPEGSEKLAAN